MLNARRPPSFWRCAQELVASDPPGRTELLRALPGLRFDLRDLGDESFPLRLRLLRPLAEYESR